MRAVWVSGLYNKPAESIHKLDPPGAGDHRPHHFNY